MSAISIGTHGLHKDWKMRQKLCLIKSAEVEQSGFCHEEMKVTKPILLHRKSDNLLVANRCGAPKVLLFFDQSDKRLDSGLQADDALSKCIRRPLLLVSQTKKDPSACNKSSNHTAEGKLN